MKFASNVRPTHITRSRKTYACCALAALLVVLVAGPGCDRRIGQQVRQSALSVFQNGVSTLSGQIDSQITGAIQSQGSTSSGNP